MADSFKYHPPSTQSFSTDIVYEIYLWLCSAFKILLASFKLRIISHGHMYHWPILATMLRSFGLPAHNNFSIIYLSNLLTLSMSLMKLFGKCVMCIILYICLVIISNVRDFWIYILMFPWCNVIIVVVGGPF